MIMPDVPARAHRDSHNTRAAFSSRRTAANASLLVAALTFAALTFAAARSPPVEVSTSDGASVLGFVGTERITDADVIAQAKDQFQQQQDEYSRELRLMQVNFEKARHDLLQQQLDKLLDRRALEMAAKAQHLSSDAVLAQIKVPAVTDDEVRAFYDANRSRSTLSFDQLAERIRAYLANQHNDTATRQFYAELRAKYGIRSNLTAFREQVAATGPVRGKANAPVTIVEFGDFQCPYCKQAEFTLQAILSKYPNDVRLVFRELPLTQLHPNAMVAAEAGVCADRQGKFWAMHDAMYADQGALDVAGLKATSKRLGLDADQLATCMSDGATATRIRADVQAAGELGIAGTPYFFVNGRPIDGSVPPEKFDSVIAEELARLGDHVASGPRAAAPQG
jgi:protein-disulfide isomerase